MIYNADEVFEMAEQMERNGAHFYERAAESVRDLPARTMLNDLARIERKHEQIFAALRDELTRREPLAFDPDGEAARYLDAMTTGKVFDVSDPGGRIGPDASLRDVLTVALEIEKNSVIYYTGLQELVPPSLGRDKVFAIIREEMRHIRLVSEELARVS